MTEAVGQPHSPVEIESLDGIEAAIEIQGHRQDSFGVLPKVRHNLAMRASAVATGLAAAYSVGLNELNIEAIPTGVIYAGLGNLAVGGVLYGAMRARGSRKARRAEIAQDEVREALGEPVDVLRPRKKMSVLRWYGCDEAFYESDPARARSAGEDEIPEDRLSTFDPMTASFGLGSIVAFAKEAGLSHVAVSTKMLDALTGDQRDPAKYGTVVSNDSLLVRRRIAASDLCADDEVLLCDIAGAEELAKQAQAAPMNIVIELLKRTTGNHPFLPWAQRIIESQYDAALVERGRRVLHDRVNQGDDFDLRKVKLLDTYGGFAGYARTEVYSELRGGDRVSTGIVNWPSGFQESYYRGRTSLLRASGFETLAELLSDTYTKRESLLPGQVRELAELAAWLLLHTDHNKVRLSGDNVQGGSHTIDGTFLQRAVVEQPRSVLWHLRVAGRNNHGEPTIEYHRRGIPRARRALATLAMFGTFVAAGSVAGSYLNKMISDNYNRLQRSYALSHGDKNGTPSLEQTDDFLNNYLPRVPGVDGTINRVYTSAANFDGTITDALAPYMPSALAAQLAPYADPGWEYQKEVALHGLDNAYDDLGNSASIGDVTTNLDGTAWSLTPSSKDVSTEGYWVQSMQDYLDASNDLNNTLTWTPPYQNFGMDFETDGNMDVAQLTQYPVRAVDLQDPKALQGRNYIRVDGQRYFDLSELVTLHLPGPYGPGYDSNIVGAYALPVLKGADVVAAEAKMYSLNDNKFLGENKIRVVQLEDGTFYMVMDDSKVGSAVHNPMYVDISYWVEPNSKTALPVRARHPMQLGGAGSLVPSMPLTQGLKTQDALKIWRTLSGDAQATTLPTAQQADAIVRAHKGYSYTPYADSGVRLSLSRPSSVSSGLGIIGETAAAMPVDNCNVTEAIAVLASKGETADGGFANNTTGYWNADGNNTLVTGEAHDWLTTNKSEIIDGVPFGSENIPHAKPQTFNPNMSPISDLRDVGLKGLEAALVLGLAYTGIRTGRRYAHPIARGTTAVARSALVAPAAARLQIPRQQNLEAGGEQMTTTQAKPVTSSLRNKRLRKAAEQRARLHRLASIVMWMDGAGSFDNTFLDEDNPPEHFKYLEGTNDLRHRYNSLAVRSGRDMRRQIERLLEAGKLRLRPGTERELVQLARRHRRAQPLLRPKSNL